MQKMRNRRLTSEEVRKLLKITFLVRSGLGGDEICSTEACGDTPLAEVLARMFHTVSLEYDESFYRLVLPFELISTHDRVAFRLGEILAATSELQRGGKVSIGAPPKTKTTARTDRVLRARLMSLLERKVHQLSPASMIECSLLLVPLSPWDTISTLVDGLEHCGRHTYRSLVTLFSINGIKQIMHLQHSLSVGALQKFQRERCWKYLSEENCRFLSRLIAVGEGKLCVRLESV